MTTDSKGQKILPDTSLYTSPLDRLNAAVLVEKERLAGAKVLCAIRDGRRWESIKIPHYDLSYSDYKSQIEPRVFWINIHISGNITVHTNRSLAAAHSSDGTEIIKVVESD